jgi:hypothetical protein
MRGRGATSLPNGKNRAANSDSLFYVSAGPGRELPSGLLDPEQSLPIGAAPAQKRGRAEQQRAGQHDAQRFGHRQIADLKGAKEAWRRFGGCDP